ncbi:nascent polypeptide-associated complex subunit alpha, muscle-specific form-like [Anopheles maculipalpis]|uniref:nascent polypeptide-associated complex subunit alpha, muscle-specific form-like n=1 Tax=Anopheles maculipalpis TaxID=1496333 RepID=UPI00215998FA|nr:nascent polypeptide-associated complex subunit alpha, muscle-specific form-like [Anopheles maculipalpis]
MPAKGHNNCREIPVSVQMYIYRLIAAMLICLCLTAVATASSIPKQTTSCSTSQDCSNRPQFPDVPLAGKSKRSAAPIMNELTPRSSTGDRSLLAVSFDSNSNSVLETSAGPSGRNGKDLLDESYQRTKELAMNISNVQRAVLASQQQRPPPFRVQGPVQPQGSRQNPNPDIQDIITGIVKLLNGNVNVHANPQPTRRHSATRINNRGPPRISEAQPLPNEYEGELGAPTSTRPLLQQDQGQQSGGPSQGPRPDHPVRPFLTGVPIPEQIVPSMQQTYRPGFVSQNRPPWQRPKPRPPISPNRRPIPPYKPYPTNLDYRPDPSNYDGSGPSNTGPIAIPTNNDGGNAIDNVTEKVIEDPPYELPSAGGNYPTTTQGTTETNPEVDVTTTTAAASNADLEENKPAEEASNKRRPTTVPTEVQYTIESATSAASVMPANGPNGETYDPEVVPSVYEINSIEYLPSSGVLEPTPSTSSAIITSSTGVLEPSTSGEGDHSITITPTPTLLPTSETSTITKTTTTTNAAPSESITSDVISPTKSSATASTDTTKPPPDYRFQPRPGLVLDDPDFKPGGGAGSGSSNAIRTQNLPPFANRPEIYTAPPPPGSGGSGIAAGARPPNYGEIFDVTLSAIQGPGGAGGSGSQQTIKINPYYNRPGPGTGPEASIILTGTGTDGFVSIDGKRSYIDLFGTETQRGQKTQIQPTPTRSAGPPASTERPKPPKLGPTPPALQPGIVGTGYAVPETESPVHAGPIGGNKPPTGGSGQLQRAPSVHQSRPKYPGALGLPPVRIDTCIVGDDSTCDQAQNERCKTENGVSSCHCRPGYARRKHREPCRRIVSLMLSMRVDKIYERRIHWDVSLADRSSEKYQQLSYEAIRAMDSAMSMTPFSDEFLEARINGIYTVNPSAGSSVSGSASGAVFVNYTVNLDENAETLRPALRSDIQRHLLGVIHRRNNNIGNSALYVEAPTGAVSSVQDVDECTSDELNDCDEEAHCTNLFGTFRCECNVGFRDPWADQPQRAGRECLSCPESYCTNRGTCSYDNANNRQVCKCLGSYYGTQCEIDGEVLGVAVGASVAAVVIIVLTLICLVMWSRKWQREHKNAMGSPVFGYLGNGQVKTPVMGQAPYQVTLEDRMRWAQIADVMAQANHYAVSYIDAEPVAGRPSSAMFGYPNLQTIGSMNTLSLHGTLPMHTGTLPPVPLPRTLGLNRNGMRTLENSSSSEEEDRADLLGRNFNVPRPKSRSNASVTSGIYYDVDYAPTGAEQLYGGGSTLGGTIGGGGLTGGGGGGGTTKSQSSIPMSTYTSSGRPLQSTYYK